LDFFGERFLFNREGKRFLPHPVEPWIFWETYLSNFRWERFKDVPRRRGKDDISLNEIQRLRKIVKLILRYQNKERFLSKYTDFPRIAYFLQVFPDAKFIHVLRDGRAVSYSIFDRMMHGNFGFWYEREWWIKGWPKFWSEDWFVRGMSPISFAAYMWKYFLNEIWEDSKDLPKSQYIEIIYENLINFRNSTLEKVLDFCDLKSSARLYKYLEKSNLENMNYKWRERLDNKQKMELYDLIYEEKYRQYFEENQI
jgi:hypothetical protein